MKLHLLDLGSIEYDEGFPLAGAGVSTLSEPNPAAARRKESSRQTRARTKHVLHKPFTQE